MKRHSLNSMKTESRAGYSKDVLKPHYGESWGNRGGYVVRDVSG